MSNLYKSLYLKLEAMRDTWFEYSLSKKLKRYGKNLAATHVIKEHLLSSKPNSLLAKLL